MDIQSAKASFFLATTKASACRNFYEGVLGLDLVEEDDFAVVYQLAGAELRISKVPQFTPQPFTVLDWQVGDILAMRTYLLSKGVEPLVFDGMGQDTNGIWTVPGTNIWILWFKDPDENVLSVSQRA
ncbi:MULTISPECIES: VOC family protein [Henriciella]|jgi:catechol 2,3-dioxygenase-like lactoylglutathione lyase family enzyme|uniref:VOC family protein n=1 Tax=Henriciella TaxID=453849 RepID=UPI003519D678